MLTDIQLSQIMRNAAPAKRQSFLAPLNDAMQKHGITSLLRTAAFIAQLAHESGEFRFMEELWGPTAAQKRYEPPSDLANRLGNTQAGDGKRFKGRGPIQITGRFNYKKYGDLLGIDLTAEPERAATPEVGFATAGLFWERNGLNAQADAGKRALAGRLSFVDLSASPGQVGRRHAQIGIGRHGLTHQLIQTRVLIQPPPIARHRRRDHVGALPGQLALQVFAVHGGVVRQMIIRPDDLTG